MAGFSLDEKAGWLDTKAIGERNKEHFVDIFDHSTERIARYSGLGRG